RVAHHRDRRAGAAAVLRLEVRGLHADLADGIERRRRIVATVRSGVLVRDAVVGEVEPAAAAIDRQAAHAAPARRLARARVDHTRQQFKIAGEVASLEGDVFNLLALDHRGSRRAVGLHERRFRLDGDLFVQAVDLERDRTKRDAFGRTELDALLLVGLEAAHRNGDVVGARQQIGKYERTIGTGDRLPRAVRAGVLEDDCDTGHHAAARVRDGP